MLKYSLLAMTLMIGAAQTASAATSDKKTDLLSRYHLTKASALAAAVKAYDGPEACKSYLQNPPMKDAYDLESVSRVPAGLAVTIMFNVGAAESCGDTPAIIPLPDGSAHETTVQSFHNYSGTLGKMPIEMTLGFSSSKIIDGSRYFYRKYHKDIPLRGTASSGLHLTEPGGGVFVLHTVNDGSGLAGTWSGDGHTLPVTLSADR